MTSEVLEQAKVLFHACGMDRNVVVQEALRWDGERDLTVDDLRDPVARFVSMLSDGERALIGWVRFALGFHVDVTPGDVYRLDGASWAGVLAMLEVMV